MRPLMLAPVVLVALTTLSGCAGWVVFGHTIQGTSPASTPAARQSSAPSPSSSPLASPPDDQSAPRPPPTSPEPSPLKSVTLTFSPGAQQKIAVEPQFQQRILQAAIENELRAHKLLSDDDPHAQGTAEIRINDFATRPSSNAVVFGYVLGTSSLTGDIEVHQADGRATQDAQVTAESHMAKSVDGGQANPFGPLYHQFAVATVNTLTGKPARPEEFHNGQDRPPN